METFEQWWERDGRFFDPDTDDVHWFDKRKSLAEYAFNKATAQSRNFTCNDEVFPTEVNFSNGRMVQLKGNVQKQGDPNSIVPFLAIR